MSKHTPGPWEFSHRKGKDGMYRTEVFSQQHGVIATCDWTPKQDGNGGTATYREDNARLIAAAPDLLEALELCLDGLITYAPAYMHGIPKHEYIEKARAAIVKARGKE